MLYAGIDGCKSGWFCVFLDEAHNWEIGIYPKIDDVISKYKQLESVFIDMPIGLPYHEKRKCDSLARKILGRQRSSSIFPIPCREAVYAKNYTEACIINSEILGKKLSKQTWNICGKIKEIDEFLINNRKYKNTLKEAHPELNFYGWNYATPMHYNKKCKEGIEERSNVLNENLSKAKDIISYSNRIFKRSEVNMDDILDALILALSATKKNEMKSIPNQREKDKRNLDMNIWYYVKTKKPA
jgi:predicted RNase H-like nuclease